jgi:hypothetical protein
MYWEVILAPKGARSGSLDASLHFPCLVSKHRSHFGSFATEVPLEPFWIYIRLYLYDYLLHNDLLHNYLLYNYLLYNYLLYNYLLYNYLLYNYLLYNYLLYSNLLYSYLL